MPLREYFSNLVRRTDDAHLQKQPLENTREMFTEIESSKFFVKNSSVDS